MKNYPHGQWQTQPCWPDSGVLLIKLLQWITVRDYKRNIVEWVAMGGREWRPSSVRCKAKRRACFCKIRLTPPKKYFRIAIGKCLQNYLYRLQEAAPIFCLRYDFFSFLLWNVKKQYFEIKKKIIECSF